MHVPDFHLHESHSLAHAGQLKDRWGPEARFLAGGTDLLVDLKSGRLQTQHVISITRIRELRGITVQRDGLHIGALTTITELNRSLVIRESFAALHDASSQMASSQIRNMATAGGNIASAVPCADLPPVLMAMNSEVVLWSTRGLRQLPLESFFTGPRDTALHADELLKEIIVPPSPPRSGYAYARFALRDGNAIAVAAVAAGLQFNSDDTIQDASVVLGAVAAVPTVVHAAGRLLKGRIPGPEIYEAAAEEAMKASHPISDVRGSAQYRRHLIGILTPQALTHAADRAREHPS